MSTNTTGDSTITHQKSPRIKSGWKNNNAKIKQYNLCIGDKGFLCSCNGQEKYCIRECYNILNKYTDQLSEESEINISKDVSATTSTSQNESLDLDQQLEEEIKDLKGSGKVSGTSRRFQVANSGAKNLLFIRTTIEDPVLLASRIVRDIHDVQTLQARFLIRLVPIEVTCKAYIDQIKKACVPLLDKHFKDSKKSFSIIYNHRNNNNLSRDEVIQEIAKLIEEYGKDHNVDLDNADVSIIVEVIKGIALLAVIPQYLKYKKFNLRTLSGQSNTSAQNTGPDNTNK